MFTKVEDLFLDLEKKVNSKFLKHIKIKEDYNLILLPSNLKCCFNPSDLMIQFDYNIAKQGYVLNILKFIQTNITHKNNQELNKVILRLKRYLEVKPAVNKVAKDASFGPSQAQNVLNLAVKECNYLIEF